MSASSARTSISIKKHAHSGGELSGDPYSTEATASQIVYTVNGGRATKTPGDNWQTNTGFKQVQIVKQA